METKVKKRRMSRKEEEEGRKKGRGRKTAGERKFINAIILS